MSALAEIRRLYEHAAWADGLVLAALRDQAGAPPAALKEFGHVLGADETWLSRLEGRAPLVAVWPALDLVGLERLCTAVHRALAAYLARLDDAALTRDVTYTNSAGKTFTNAVKDILHHAALHGQYHRGKINLLLREAGLEPAPCDYIAFIRGAPAARS